MNEALSYLGCLELGLQLLLFALARKLGILIIDLISHLIDISFELILLLLRIGDQLVLHDHARFLLCGSFL